MRIRGIGVILSILHHRLTRIRRYDEVWIDVGAHLGETTLLGAKLHRRRRIVYAFEPNLPVALRCAAVTANFVVLPYAVSEEDGSALLRVNAYETSSSLLPLNEDGVRSWIGGERLREVAQVPVPTIRLDTFMEAAAITAVDHLKIDAQGLDLAVLRSAGSRLRDVRRITVEATVGSTFAYQGQDTMQAIVGYLEERGFTLLESEMQSYGQEVNLQFSQSSRANLSR